MRALAAGLLAAGLAAALLAATAPTGDALALGARPLSSTMTCAQTQALVRQSGALILGFTPTTYDRVVADRRFCLPGQVTELLRAPTRDMRQCPVGYVCREFDYDVF